VRALSDRAQHQSDLRRIFFGKVGNSWSLRCVVGIADEIPTQAFCVKKQWGAGMMKLEKLAAVLLAAATVMGLAASAGAVDGTIEINQAKVLAAGGFPYTISNSGSYRLTGNLTPPSNVDGIDVTVSNVTIDLNGFSLTNLSGTPVGINSSAVGEVTVENGTVVGFGGVGVEVGGFSTVRNVHADGNGSGIQGGVYTVVEGCTADFSLLPSGFGIGCGEGCRITGNTVNGHGGNGDGIDCAGNGFGCVITGNTVSNNGKVGINCLGDGCVISGNTAISNTGIGLRCGGSGCLISGNTSVGNSGGGIQGDATTGYGGNVLKNTNNLFGGTSLGHNLCSGAVC
jgi:parallel beta-helix repeat protein